MSEEGNSGCECWIFTGTMDRLKLSEKRNGTLSTFLSSLNLSLGDISIGWVCFATKQKYYTQCMHCVVGLRNTSYI